MDYKPGEKVKVRSAFGDELDRIATSTVTQGLDFLVVWVCEVEEWEAAQSEMREPRSTPWPAEAVTAQEGVSA